MDTTQIIRFIVYTYTLYMCFSLCLRSLDVIAVRSLSPAILLRHSTGYPTIN